MSMLAAGTGGMVDLVDDDGLWFMVNVFSRFWKKNSFAFLFNRIKISNSQRLRGCFNIREAVEVCFT